MPENQITEQALIVESRLHSRREIAGELSRSGLVEHIIEAQSVADGLNSLATAPMDACFLGPSLTEETACGFLKQGIQVVKKKDCAFIAILNPNCSYEDRLIRAGADATLHRPLQRTTFTEVVQKAIRNAHEHPRETRTYKLAVSESLKNTAIELKKVAAQITQGDLNLSSTGKPSLATRDAIRIAFETSFPNPSSITEMGTFDHHFLSCLIEWFIDRLEMPDKLATETLRLRLLSFQLRETF